MSKAQETLKLLNEELAERLKDTPHVLRLVANKGGLTVTKKACECADSHYCPGAEVTFSWAVLWDARRNLLQGYTFKARAHKFTIMMHHSPLSVKFRLRRRGVKLELRATPCPAQKRRTLKHIDLMIPWGLLQALYVRRLEGEGEFAGATDEAESQQS